MNTHPQEGRTVSDYAQTLYRRRWTAALVAASVLAAMAAYAFLSDPVYRASALVDIEKVSDVVAQGSGYQAPDDDYLATQTKLIVSETALRKVYDGLHLAQTEEFAAGVGSLRRASSVLSVPRTRLCYVSAESRDPALASAIANALAQNYVRQNLDNQLFMPKDVLAALRTRATGPDARRIYESLPAVINNPLIQEIKGQILKGEVALADLRGRYTAAHPAVLAMEAQLRLMRAARDTELDNVVRSVTTALSGQLRPNNVRIVDPARPPESPARPRRPLALVIGLLGGLGLGLLAALAVDSLDQTVRTHTDLERKLGLPFLGLVPLSRLKKGEKVYAPLLSDQDTVSSEAFRDLRTMVAIAKDRSSDPFILVTSALQEEGKSFVATNLAVALSQVGRKTLLVEGDLRRPSLHRNLGDPSKAGLANLLSGSVDSVEAVIQRTDIPNLDVIGSGKAAANASELLNARQLAVLADWVAGRYERIVIDCPPVFPVGDVLLWGRHVRSAILVSRCGRTPVPLLQLACERLRAGGVEVLGGVLNGAPGSALSYVYGGYFAPRLTDSRPS